MVVVVSKATFATSTTVSANQASGTNYEFIGPGIIKFFCFPSNADVRYTLSVGGTPIADPNSQPSRFGATGGMGNALPEIEQKVTGGRVILTFVSTTGAPTVDFRLEWYPL